MNLLDKPKDIVLDTHAIKEIILKEENKWILEVIKKICHTLIIPDLRPEYKVHIGQFLMLLSSLLTILRGKIVPDVKPSKLPKDVERSLKRSGADKGDLIVAGVAYRRSRGSRVLIVSDDACFHNAYPSLRKYGIEVAYVKEFLNEASSIYTLYHV